MQSCDNQTELASELNLQSNYYTLGKRHFCSKSTWEQEIITFLTCGYHQRADAFLAKFGRTISLRFDAKTRFRKRETRPTFPKIQ